MKLVIGLGNPGEKYKETRHNAGWLALDFFREKLNFSKTETFGKSKICKLSSEFGSGLFVYPQTFMNESGEAVLELLNFYKLSREDILILHDEIDLPLGAIRFTASSSAAGHNGVKSIIEKLGSQDFKRIRIGIENRENKKQIPTDAFVLQNFNSEELQKIPYKEILGKVQEFLK